MVTIIILLTMMDSFYVKYLDEIINNWTSHIRIVSKNSPKLKPNSAFSVEEENLSLIKIDSKIEQFISNMPEVQAYSPVIETYGNFFTIDSDFQGFSWIRGIVPDSISKVLPGVIITEKNANFNYDPNNKDIPIVRGFPTSSEIIIDNDKFQKKDFRIVGDKFDNFKKQVIKDFPQLFSDTNIEKDTNSQIFISSLNKSLLDPNLYKVIPSTYFDNYDWKIDDTITKIKSLDPNSKKEIAKWNKRLYCSLYPDIIFPVPEEITLNKPLTLQVMPAKNKEILSSPIIIPITFVSYAKGIPMYPQPTYIDINIFREYLDLESNECTDFVIRLKDKQSIQIVKDKIQKYLIEQNYDYKVIDFFQADTLGTPIATSFSIVILIPVILLFCAIVIFILNMIMLSIIKRKREIGTSLAIGMTKGENIIIFLGEVFIIVTLSWLISIVVGSAAIIYLANNGLSGMFFFNSNKLFFVLDFKHTY